MRSVVSDTLVSDPDPLLSGILQEFFSPVFPRSHGWRQHYLPLIRDELIETQVMNDDCHSPEVRRVYVANFHLVARTRVKMAG